jgi:hypothetical protein
LIFAAVDAAQLRCHRLDFGNLELIKSERCRQ